MTKYEPLEQYLRGRSENEVPMTFKEIEGVIAGKLPPSANRREWWSNNEQSSVITRAWKRAGYESTKVDMAGRKLVFRRVAATTVGSPAAVAESTATYAPRGRHPLWGALKGLVTVARGTDLSAPADPDWGARSK